MFDLDLSTLVLVTLMAGVLFWALPGMLRRFNTPSSLRLVLEISSLVLGVLLIVVWAGICAC